MIKDVDLRFEERPVAVGANETRVIKVLQWRKLVKQGPTNNWAWGWTEWEDVPILEDDHHDPWGE